MTDHDFGPLRRRRRVEDIALIDYVLRVAEVRHAQGGPPIDVTQAVPLLDAFRRGIDPEEHERALDH